MLDDLCEQLLAAVGFHRSDTRVLQRGRSNRVEAFDVLLEMPRRGADHRHRGLLDLVLPLQTGSVCGPQHRGDERHEQHADRRRQLAAD